MRLIDADNAKKEVYKTIIKGKKRGDQNIIGLVRYALDSVPTVNEWISVKERLPDMGKDVLVLVGADMFVMALDRKDQETADIEWEDAHGYIAEMWEVTHWMQLPPPPEGGQDD